MAEPQTMAQTTLEARKTEPALTLSRSFQASLERVYAALAEEAQIVRWFGPQGCTIESCDWQPAEGRPWRISMRFAGDEAFHVGGVFREVVPGERLVLTWIWENSAYAGLETLVTLAFEALGDMTKLTLTHAWLPDAEARDRHARGWNSSLDKLADLLA